MKAPWPPGAHHNATALPHGPLTLQGAGYKQCWFPHSTGNPDLARRTQHGHHWLGRGRERTMPIGPGPWTITIQLERQVASPSELPQGRRHLLFLSCPSCQQELVHPTLPQAKTPPTHAGAQRVWGTRPAAGVGWGLLSPWGSQAVAPGMRGLCDLGRRLAGEL